MENKSKAKSFFNVIKNIITWIIVAAAVFMMIFTVVSVSFFDKNDRDIFGYRFLIVRSASMAATDFDAGDIIISKDVDITKINEGDIITFISENSHNYGETVTHKVRKITTDSEGNLAFVTYGTTTNVDDETLATMVLGKYTGRIAGLGHFFAFLKTTPGYIICILMPFLLLIISQGINCIRLFRRYKKEQLAEIEEERLKLAEERAESHRMMEELMALKAQLAAKEAGEQKSEDTSEN